MTTMKTKRRSWGDRFTAAGLLHIAFIENPEPSRRGGMGDFLTALPVPLEEFTDRVNKLIALRTDLAGKRFHIARLTSNPFAIAIAASGFVEVDFNPDGTHYAFLLEDTSADPWAHWKNA